MPAQPRKFCAIVHTGDYDRIYNLFSVAGTSIALGMEVHLFFSYWALKTLRRSAIDNPVFSGDKKELEDIMRERIKKGHLAPLSQIIKEARNGGKIKIYACSQSMNLFTLKKEDLIEEVDQVAGLSTFLTNSEGAEIMLFV